MLQAPSKSSRQPGQPHHFSLLHIWDSLERLGGVESLVRLMIRHDSASAAISLLDLGEPASPQVFRLRAHRMNGAAFARKRIARTELSADVVIFHNFAGMSMLGGSIPHRRAVLFLHTNSEDVFEHLPRRLKYLDAILTSGGNLAQELRERFPQCPVPIMPLECPLSEPFFGAIVEKKTNSLMLGYSGRLEAEQKQVGRLVELCGCLEAQGMNFWLEIAGSGLEESCLRRRLAGKPVKFLGRLNETQMAAAYRDWDFLVCTSDYETGPLVALEAMAAGVPPIMPDIPCQATVLLRQHGFSMYPRGDMAAAAKLIQHLTAQENRADYRKKIQQLVANRNPETFAASLAGELAKILQSPSHAARMKTPAGLVEWLPFNIRCRLPGKGKFLR